MDKGKKLPKDIKSAYRVSYLLAGHIRQKLTDAEKEELEAWKNEDEHNQKLFAELTDEDNIQELLTEYKKPDTESYLEKSKEQLTFIKRNQRNKIWSYVAAAGVISAAFILFYFKPFSTNSTEEPIIAGNAEADILPGDTVASITLGNGKTVRLTSNRDTVINGQAVVSGSQGEVVYGSQSMEVEQHTLSVPRKGFFRLTLPDGTKVWLNSSTSITYPTAFNGNERRVKVNGETYFEVAPDKNKPFRVETDLFTVEAVGTAFNVNTYTDEPIATTTLVEGVVKLTNANHTTLLKPGQQWQLAGNQSKVVQTDTRPYTAWINDEFRFSNTPLDAIMRQVARWYDAEVVFKDAVSVELNATIEKDVPLSKLLHLLAKTDEVHFSIEGNKIIVTK